MKRIITLTIGLFLMVSAAKADEGMWLLHMLKKINEAEMQQMGLNLSAEDIYSINNASLKDAIVMLNGGMCTAEVISPEGLVLTNHHCAYGSIQGFSTPENDYLTNGFWAMSKKEELNIPDFEVSFLVRIEDVSAKVLESLNDDMTEGERQAAAAAAMGAISTEATEGTDYNAQVKSFYYGSEYYLFVYNTYRDVRLVGAPPESIGKYGGDTDNWMWPRHTGDFSMLRIYADAENNPADFADTNVPYSPKRFLKVSLDGVQAGDFTMIMGYPGSTDRYLSSYGVQQALDVHNPSVVEVRDMKLKTMKKHMDADKGVRIQYASKYASTANYWKYYIGQSKGLKRLNVYDKKKDLEQAFTKWSTGDKERQARYGEALTMIEDYYKATDATEKGDVYALEAGLIGADLTLFALRVNRTLERYWPDKETAAKMTEEEIKANQEGIKARLQGLAEDFFKDFDYDTDKDVFVALTTMYMNNVDKSQQPAFFDLINGKYKASAQIFADKVYPKSILTSKERFMAFLEKPNQKIMKKEPLFDVANQYYALYLGGSDEELQAKFDKGYRLFVEGVRKMQPTKKFYPDANSTMRLTYGQVGDYYPADAVHYDFITTADGVLEKKDNTNPEFVVPAKLEELLKAEDFGQYANDNGDLVICFIHGNDITGGNSGSPVMNANGDLIGLAFDGNWEAMSGDIAFEPELQRTISVDIRYVMFIIDKFAGAQNLIDEIVFVKEETKPVAPPKEDKAEAK
jgi:hypothetical protein